MDFTLPARKLFVGHLERARVRRRETGAPVAALGNLLFQRAWIQGVVVGYVNEAPASAPANQNQAPATQSQGSSGRIRLDDGTGCVEVVLTKTTPKPKLGAYVLLIGALIIRPLERYIKAHKLVDLSNDPNREAVWCLEVIEAHRRFYDQDKKAISASG